MQKTAPPLFDFAALVRQRNRAARQFDEHDFLAEAAAERLADRLADVRRQFADGLVLGAGDGRLARHLAATGKTATLTQAEASPDFLARLAEPKWLLQSEIPELAPASLDVIASSLWLHWVSDLPGLLACLSRALRPDGLFVANFWGGRSLAELRACLAEAESEQQGGVWPRIAPMADIRDLGGLLQRAGLALPVADADLIKVRWPSLFAMMRDLRGMAETSALAGRSRHFTRRSVFMRAAEIYQQRFADPDGQITASFELITLTGWKPHPSQQKPLNPGSAANRLADHLISDKASKPPSKG